MNIKSILVVLSILISTGDVFAQEIEWQNTIGGSAYDQFRSVKQTSDGGYICAGSSISNMSGDKTENNLGLNDYWVVKLSSVGVVQWQNTIGGNQNDWMTSIEQTSDGGFICGGSSLSGISGDKTENSQGGGDYWIIKLNGAGNIEWQNTIGGSGLEQFSSVKQTTDGGYICAGYTLSGISGDKMEVCFGNNDYWIVKLNAAGIIQWQNTIGGNDQDYLNSIQQTADGGYICGGTSNSPASFDKAENSNGFDIWVVKLDLNGVIQWQNTIGGGLYDGLTSIIQTTNGHYICAGFSDSNISGDKTEDSMGDSDFWLLNLDASGNIVWQNTIGGAMTDVVYTIQQSVDGGYFCGGESQSIISGDKTEGNLGTSDYWVLKLDSNGIVQWQNTIGGSNVDIIVSCEQTQDQGYICGGYSESGISGDKTENCIGGLDYWIVKLSGKTNLIKGTVYIDSNSNGIKDASDEPVRFKNVTEVSTGRFAVSDNFGNYTLSVLNSGNFQVIPTPLNYYSAVPASHSANFSGILQTDSNNVFSMEPIGTINDLCVTITPTSNFRAGQPVSYQINYSNDGNTTLNPTIVFYKDQGLSYVSAVPTPTSVYPDSIVYSFGPMNPFQTGQININLMVNSSVPGGTLINSGVIILPLINDYNPFCNQSYWEVFTTASFDPNDILVNKDTLFDNEIASLPQLEYIIRFQNTGNDTAFYVRVDNKISGDLQLNTFEFVSASHACNIEYQSYDSTMKFIFNNILLPDSGINETKSHGYVRYKIKPQSSLMVGETIRNYAMIYFDYNAPVWTNTATTDIVLFSSDAEVASQTLSVLLYPSPVEDILRIELKNQLQQHAVIELYNTFGQKVKVFYSGMISAKKWNATFDVSDIENGIYLLSINGKVIFTKKFVKL